MKKTIYIFIISIFLLFTLCSCDFSNEISYEKFTLKIKEYSFHKEGAYPIRYNNSNNLLKNTYMDVEGIFISIQIEEKIYLWNSKNNDLYIYHIPSIVNETTLLTDLLKYTLTIDLNLISFLDFLESENNISFIQFDFLINEIVQEVLKEDRSEYVVYRKSGTQGVQGRFHIDIPHDKVIQFPLLSQAIYDFNKYITIDENEKVTITIGTNAPQSLFIMKAGEILYSDSIHSELLKNQRLIKEIISLFK